MVKTLYIFAGVDRVELEKKVKAGISPDTSFLGYFHTAGVSGIEAEYLHLSKKTYGWGGSFIRKYTPLKTLYLFMILYPKLKQYDVIVITSSAYFELMFFKHFGFFQKQKFIIFNLDLSMSFNKFRDTYFKKKIYFKTIDIAEKIICISQVQQRDLTKLGISHQKAVFMHMGIDKKFYHQVERKGHLILTVGRDIGRDFLTFLEAIKLSKKEAVMICSPYNTQGLEDKIPLNLKVLYDQPYEVLKDYYKKAKVFVIATKPSNQLVGSDCPGQTSILDTLAYGIPVVATHMPWFEGYFEPRKHLIAVEPNDVIGLSKAISEVVDNQVLAQGLSQEGRKLIDETCNSEVLGKRVADLILSIA